MEIFSQIQQVQQNYKVLERKYKIVDMKHKD